MKRIIILCFVLFCVANAQYTWKSVQIWGGGYVPGVAFHPAENGLTYIRTDVGGAYRLESDKRAWMPLNDMFTKGHDMGSIAIGLDAGNPNVVYVTGGLYLGQPRPQGIEWCGSGGAFFISSNRGATWTAIRLNTSTVSGTDPSVLNETNLCLGGNGQNRGTGNRIAASGSTIYLGTDQNGLLKSTNNGNTWTTVSTFSNTSGISAVLLDKDGNVYAAPFAGGIYKSIDGTSWSQVGSFNGAVFQMSYSPEDNTIWFTTNTGKPQDHSEPSGGSVRKLNLSTGAFTQVTMPAKGGKDYGYIGVSVNPSNANQVLVSTSGWWKGNGGPIDGSSFVPHDAIFLSMDGGQTWKDILLNASYDVATAYNAASHNPHWISALAVNPYDPDHVIFGTGYGVWSTFNATAATPEWIFTNHGIEETVPLGLASTTYGAPLVSVLGDIDGFYHADINTPPSHRHRLEDGKTEAGTNYDIDFAGQMPNYMVRIHKSSSHNFGAWSNDGGQTWKNFASKPPNAVVDNGENNYVAVSADGSAIVWNMITHGVYYSTNNGATWTKSSTEASLLQGFKPVADKVTAGTFYLYNPANGTLYKSTNNGANWNAVNNSLAQAGGNWAYWAFRLYASPNKAGELWATQGVNGVDGLWFGESRGIKRSTDGGTTFTEVSGMAYARSIGFGKGKNAGDPSAVYVVGINSSDTHGVFRSDNSGSTWTRINDDAHMYGEITMVIGDPCVYSRVFLGTSGRGIVQGIDNGLAGENFCENRIDYGSTPIRKAPIASLNAPTLMRHGNMLHSNAPIRLYSLAGKLVAASSGSLNLTHIPNGVYIAKSGTETLKIMLNPYSAKQPR